MKYKESARNPEYGKIFGYDINGKQIQEIDLLKIVVCRKEGTITEDFTVGELLRTVVDYKKDLKKIAILEKEIKLLQDKMKTLTQVAVLLDAQIKASEIK